MTFEHIGHSEFRIILENGFRIITDPYDASTGYPITRHDADAVLISHHHHDHDAIENVGGHPQCIDTPGTRTLSADLTVTGYESFHDAESGQKRGKNLLWLVETEGLRVAHLGDIGCIPEEKQIKEIAPVDILMIPIGGYFTIDAKTAKEIAERLGAKIILPMHYKTSRNAEWPIEGPEGFLSLFPAQDVRKEAEILRVTKADCDCHPKVVLFKVEKK